MAERTTDLFKEFEATDLHEHSLSPRLFRAIDARVTPHAEWVEIQTKSVLNRVHGMPFAWSINPYRGCQHGCNFLLRSADALVLRSKRRE
jgi:hypothetical protein